MKFMAEPQDKHKSLDLGGKHRLWDLPIWLLLFLKLNSRALEHNVEVPELKQWVSHMGFRPYALLCLGFDKIWTADHGCMLWQIPTHLYRLWRLARAHSRKVMKCLDSLLCILLIFISIWTLVAWWFNLKW